MDSLQLTNWVIMVMFRPRAEHDHDYPVGNAAAVVSFVEHDDDFDAWAKQAKVPASGQGAEFF